MNIGTEIFLLCLVIFFYYAICGFCVVKCILNAYTNYRIKKAIKQIHFYNGKNILFNEKDF